MKQTANCFNHKSNESFMLAVGGHGCVIDVGDGILEFINPEILETSGEQNGAEGCLSFPGEYGLVERPNYVKVRAQNRNGEWFEMEGEALFARAVCHENDHLDGVVFKDRMSRLLREDELGE